MKTTWILGGAFLLFGSAAASFSARYDVDALSIPTPRWLGFLFLLAPCVYSGIAVCLRNLSERTRFLVALMIGIMTAAIAPVYMRGLPDRLSVSRELTSLERLDLARLVDGRFIESSSLTGSTHLILVAKNSDSGQVRSFLVERHLLEELGPAARNQH